MQHALAFVPVLIFLPVVAFLLPALVRLLKSSQPSELTNEWFDNFNVSTYGPMQGLLAQDDFEFLSRQPGFDPSLFRKLRQDRLRIFRAYLNRLIADYNRLHKLANFVVSQSQEDQSDLFARLMSMRFNFWLATLKVEFSYLLCRFGSTSISIDGILQQMEEISKIALQPAAKSILVG